MAKPMAEDGTENVQAHEMQKQITAPALKKLLKDLRAKKDDIETLTGEMGSITDKATEKYYINKKALGWIRQLDRMPAEKLADFMDELLYMYEISGLEDRAKSAQRLPMGENEADDDGEDSNVTTLPQAAGARAN